MKNVFTLIIAILAFTSCSSSSYKKEPKSAIEIYNEAYEKATKSKIDIDTLFLGLRFGMTKEEVDTHLQRMKKTGKIKINALGKYEYLFKTKEEDISATIDAHYFNNNLYGLSLNLDTYYINGVPLNSMGKDVMLDKVRSLFLFKYIVNKKGFDKYSFNSEAGNTFCYINKNLVVKFNPIGQMICINAPTAAKKEAQERNAKAETVKGSISDL